ncbi:MAG: hypothetical protein H7Z17_00465 [Fuerstia sp.]|nr:hypothetical protein [Fuerstiella sp.]
MPHGDLETQSTSETATSVEAPDNLVDAESWLAEPAPESAAGVARGPATQAATVTVATTPQRSSSSRLGSRIGSAWHRLREQRREAAAVVVLIAMVMIWFDTGSSETGTAPDAPDPLDGFEATLSDFEPVEDARPMRESADPFESQSQNSFDSSLYIPSSEGSAAGNTASSDFGTSTTATARYPEDAPAFNASASQTSADYGTDQQQRRKVKFAGRIQPAN